MKIALIQLHVSNSQTAQQRRMHVNDLFNQLEDKQPDLIILPELWGVGFSNFNQYQAQAEPLYGDTLHQMSLWAKRLQCHILTGSFVEQAQHGLYNTMAMLDENGALLGTYRKMHLFGYGSKERELLTAGQKTSEISTKYGIIGLATCYDLRFPEQFRHMVSKGVTLFAVSAAWPKVRLGDWRLFCRVRALENQSFLIACNDAGHSMAVAPDGTILAEAGEQEQILLCEIDLDEVQRFRSEFPALRDRTDIK